MIFVTVGSQLPFNRLVRAMDEYAARHHDKEVFAQTCGGEYRPAHMEWASHLTPAEFRSRCAAADVIVSHAGIGNILLALELQKPIVILPRRADLQEHRNDHQLATCKYFEGKAGITVVYDEKEIDSVLQNGILNSGSSNFRPWASDELLSTIRDFINQ